MKKIIRENYDNKFNKLLTSSFISSGLMGIIGLIMLFMPKLTNKIVGFIFGLAILSIGISTIYKFIKREGAKIYLLNIIYGIALLIIGLEIIFKPLILSSFISLILGLFLIIIGANKITYGIWFKIANNQSWIITLSTGLLLIFMGILAMFNPFITLTITSLTGTFLLLTSILDISQLILLKKNSKKIIEMFW